MKGSIRLLEFYIRGLPCRARISDVGSVAEGRAFGGSGLKAFCRF